MFSVACGALTIISSHSIQVKDISSKKVLILDMTHVTNMLYLQSFLLSTLAIPMATISQEFVDAVGEEPPKCTCT